MIETTKLGIAPFDAAVGGIYFNTPTLVRGRRGGGKTILAAHFADKVLRTGERLLYFCESQPESVMLDARSAGMDFEAPARSGQLALVPIRSAFSTSSIGEFPFFEAIDEMRAMASRLSAGFAVFSSVVPWVAVSPIAAMPRRVEEFIAALSTSSLTSLLLLHKPASPAAESLASKLFEECPVVLEMESLRYAGRELRVVKYQGRDELRLPMAFPLELVSGKGLATPSAAPRPEAADAAAARFAAPAVQPASAPAPERPHHHRTTLFSAAAQSSAPAHATAHVAPSVGHAPAHHAPTRARATLFATAGEGAAVSKPPTAFSAPSASPAAPPAPAHERPHARATLFAAPAPPPATHTPPAAPPPPAAVPPAAVPPTAAPPPTVPPTVPPTGRNRIKFSNVIR